MRNKGELTERDRDELGVGDLPDDMLRERGEYPFPGPAQSNLPPDMVGDMAARKALASTGIGGPYSDYNVRGIFDSRPINGFDFNEMTHLPVPAGGEGTTFSRNACLTVPQGRVLVLRDITFYNLDDGNGNVIADNAKVYDFFAQITKNGGVVDPIFMNTGFEFFPVKGPCLVDTFLIYDEGEVLGLNLSSDSGNFVYVVFHGNLLLKTGVSANLEVANKGAGKPTTVAATASDLANPQNPFVRASPVSKKRVTPRQRILRKKHGFV